MSATGAQSSGGAARQTAWPGPTAWPQGARCAVLLTFDLDGESGLLFNDPSASDHPGALSQAAYGPKVGVYRLLDMLDAQGVRATFFIPGWIAERYPQATLAVRDAGHEIGHHGYLHERASAQKPEQERRTFEQGLAALAAVAGVRPSGFRSPSWDLTPQTLSLVRQAGMRYDSSLMDSAWPYVHPRPHRDADVSASGPTGSVSGGAVVEIPVQWHLDDWPFLGFNPLVATRSLAVPEAMFGQWREEILGAHEFGGSVTLTMHPQHSGHPSRVRALRSLIEFTRSLGDVWFPTCDELARHTLNQHAP